MKRTTIRILVIAIAVLALSIIILYINRPPFISVKLSDIAPLSAVASITAKEPVRITVRIAGKHDDDIEVQYANFATEHEIPIYGLYAQTANKVTFIFSTEEGTSYERIVTVRTDPLPEIYPEIQVERIEA
ncbi:MAG: arylsulfate sulfotransferase N-terminal domain-containing protein, partial [Candidatus Cloacimonetes bacterium]|nr:arylsulfate sulfotransferase N-terminal domain-containing protein [Candidatus Cloacimonadota bacterium]